jgi:purine-nucleoside phosphorylase
MYEGHDAGLAGFPVRVLNALGVKTLIVSNAAGGTRKTLTPGTIMLIKDHVNFMFRNPLIGEQQDGDTRFPDMSEPYDAGLRALAHRVAKELGLELAEGVYVGELGPSYETRAEVQMLIRLGADAVGMSTVPEVIVARALGMRVLGFSCITNYACGLATAPITHDEVLETTARVASRLQRLVKGVVERL